MKAYNVSPSEKEEDLKSYLFGFIFSIFFTLAAYFLVENHLATGWVLTGTLIGLCLFQVLTQLIFFLHLGFKGESGWDTVVFVFMLLVVGILVWGSIWIMYNLDYRMMPT